MNPLSDVLRNIAQNDYMIDASYLPSGKVLLEAASHIEIMENMAKELAQARVALGRARSDLYQCQANLKKERRSYAAYARATGNVIEELHDLDIQDLEIRARVDQLWELCGDV